MYYFYKDEKVFSLTATTDVVLTRDIKSLWSEFFYYLFVVGLYSEGSSGSPSTNNLSDENFFLAGGYYSSSIGNLLAKGLRDRFKVLINHFDITESEKSLLQSLNGVFSEDNPSWVDLTPKKILDVATTRELSDNAIVIARYLGVMFGQKDFLEEVALPRAYLSVFGNIHLSKQDKVIVSEPLVKFRSVIPRHGIVTPFWSFISSFSTSIFNNEESFDPFYNLCSTLTGYSIIANEYGYRTDARIPITRAAVACYTRASLGVTDSYREGPFIARFYDKLIYGNVGNIPIIRHGIFVYILNVMVKAIGFTDADRISPPDCVYRKLLYSGSVSNRNPMRSDVLVYALEALDSEVAEDEDKSEETSSDESEDTTDNLPNEVEDQNDDSTSNDSGYDPSIPPPAVPSTTPSMEEDNIELISFDKTGEGVNEDLYRRAVVALNDRFKTDENLEIKAEVKDALDYWVNSFLYRAAISATKDQIESLGLQSYLKSVSKEG